MLCGNMHYLSFSERIIYLRHHLTHVLGGRQLSSPQWMEMINIMMADDDADAAVYKLVCTLSIVECDLQLLWLCPIAIPH